MSAFMLSGDDEVPLFSVTHQDRLPSYYRTVFKQRVTMKSIVAAIFLVLFVSATNAFTAAPRAGIVSKAPPSVSTTSLNMVFGNKKSAAQKAAEKEKESKYWQGEWVCKDCGYIYNRVRFDDVLDVVLSFLSRQICSLVTQLKMNAHIG